MLEGMNADHRRTIAHVDLDAFYASVEQLDNPELRGKPVIVGGLGPRGVVSTASYEARRFGVHSAMPMSQARRRCPQAVYLRPRMERYRQASKQVFAVFHHYTPEVEGLSLDEAFLDLTASLRLFGGADTIARQIQADIRESTGLSAAVGVAHNKFLAKLTSDLVKPGGIRIVDPAKVHRLLDPLPVRRLWGVGAKTAEKLHQAGLLTIGQVRKMDLPSLRRVLGNQAEHYRALANGDDDRPVESHQGVKSISHEETFDENVGNHDRLLAVLQNQSEKVAHRLRKAGLVAGCVTIKLRDGRFTTITRQKSLPRPTSDTRILYGAAKALFEHWWHSEGGKPLRLLGMGVTQLGAGEAMMGLLHSGKLDQALDGIKERFGGEGIGFARGLLKDRE
ncbi:MAG: DNA polymerase IV [Wenzhouxiangellaceae bacterium]